MANFFGTNLVTLDSSFIYFGQTTIPDETATQISNSADLTDLVYGMFFVVVDSASFFLNAGGGDPAVTTANGIKCSANNPVFIPVKDGRDIYCSIDSSGASKIISWMAM